jgi:hypothetical protein
MLHLSLCGNLSYRYTLFYLEFISAFLSFWFLLNQVEERIGRGINLYDYSIFHEGGISFIISYATDLTRS